LKRVAILGAGGHARTLISLLSRMEIEVEGLYDDNFNPQVKEVIEGYPLLGSYSDVQKEAEVVISKGSIEDRYELYKQFEQQLFQPNVIHDSAVIESKKVGIANQISALTFIAETASIGDHNIIYSQSCLEHEVEIGNHNILTVNVSLCGRAKLGSFIYVGAGAVILPNVEICDHVIIGAGAVVTQSIHSPGTYVGLPAKKMK
jgi:sugar O-acyltransferase (sialic acid O-acetyltransferase NeuD family)